MKHCIKKKINYLRIQRFKRLTHWFHFDSVRDVLHVLTVEKFELHSNESVPYFGDGRNNVAFFNGKLPHQTPIKRVVFSDCSRFWKPQSLPQQQSKHSATPPAQQIILPPRFWVITTSRDQGLYSTDQERKRRETLGTRLISLRLALTSLTSAWITVQSACLQLALSDGKQFS